MTNGLTPPLMNTSDRQTTVVEGADSRTRPIPHDCYNVTAPSRDPHFHYITDLMDGRF